MNNFQIDLLWRAGSSFEAFLEALGGAMQHHSWELKDFSTGTRALSRGRKSPPLADEPVPTVVVPLHRGWLSVARPSLNRSDFPLISDDEWTSMAEFPVTELRFDSFPLASRVGLQTRPPVMDLHGVRFSLQPRPFLEPDPTLQEPLTWKTILECALDVPGLIFGRGFYEGSYDGISFPDDANGIDLSERLDENLGSVGYLRAPLISQEMKTDLERLEALSWRWLDEISSEDTNYRTLYARYGISPHWNCPGGIAYYCGKDPASKVLGYWMDDMVHSLRGSEIRPA